MKTRPILMNGPMVRAVLSGQKTQTRRLVKGIVEDVRRGDWYADRRLVHKPTCQLGFCETVDDGVLACDGYDLEPNGAGIRSPYGGPGDRLWVRETWGLFDTEPKDGEKAKVFYRATDGDRDELRYQLWRPSIHMPRWASRITLEVVSVRVERLQDITEADAIAEGVTVHTLPEEWQAARARVGGPNVSISLDREPSQALIEELELYDVRHYPARPVMAAVQAFERLWESINGPGSWAANPWVWRIEFKRVVTETR